MEEERAARVMSSLIRVMGSRITSTIYFTVWLDLRPFSWRSSALVVVELHVAPPRGGRLNAEHGALLVAPARDLVEEHELLHVARGRDPPRQVGLPYTQRKTGSEPVLPASTRSKLGVLTIRAGHATFFLSFATTTTQKRNRASTQDKNRIMLRFRCLNFMAWKHLISAAVLSRAQLC